MTQAFENYTQLRVMKRPFTGVYLSFFLMVTLLILVGSTWMGLYIAKRITRPVQLLAAAAREIGAGRLDQRIEPEGDDEFGALVEAFNAMASEVAAGLLSLDRRIVGQPLLSVFDRADLQPLAQLLSNAGRAKADPIAQEIAI